MSAHTEMRPQTPTPLGSIVNKNGAVIQDLLPGDFIGVKKLLPQLKRMGARIEERPAMEVEQEIDPRYSPTRWNIVFETGKETPITFTQPQPGSADYAQSGGYAYVNFAGDAVEVNVEGAKYVILPGAEGKMRRYRRNQQGEEELLPETVEVMSRSTQDEHESWVIPNYLQMYGTDISTPGGRVNVGIEDVVVTNDLKRNRGDLYITISVDGQHSDIIPIVTMGQPFDQSKPCILIVSKDGMPSTLQLHTPQGGLKELKDENGLTHLDLQAIASLIPDFQIPQAAPSQLEPQPAKPVEAMPFDDGLEWLDEVQPSKPPVELSKAQVPAQVQKPESQPYYEPEPERPRRRVYSTDELKRKAHLEYMAFTRPIEDFFGGEGYEAETAAFQRQLDAEFPESPHSTQSQQRVAEEKRLESERIIRQIRAEERKAQNRPQQHYGDGSGSNASPSQSEAPGANLGGHNAGGSGQGTGEALQTGHDLYYEGYEAVERDGVMYITARMEDGSVQNIAVDADTVLDVSMSTNLATGGHSVSGLSASTGAVTYVTLGKD
jgi:hypothetical protein